MFQSCFKCQFATSPAWPSPCPQCTRLLIDPSTVDIQHTLYRGIMQQQWTVKAIYSHLRDRDSSRLPMAMAKWDGEIGMVGGQEWLKACEQIHSIRDIRLQSFHLLFLNRRIRPQCTENALCTGQPTVQTLQR